jgi:hypothetical protein
MVVPGNVRVGGRLVSDHRAQDAVWRQGCFPDKAGRDTSCVVPETRYAKAADGSYLAYQAFGQGNTDLPWLPGFASHLEVFGSIRPQLDSSGG